MICEEKKAELGTRQQTQVGLRPEPGKEWMLPAPQWERDRLQPLAQCRLVPPAGGAGGGARSRGHRPLLCCKLAGCCPEKRLLQGLLTSGAAACPGLLSADGKQRGPLGGPQSPPGQDSPPTWQVLASPART